MNVSSTCRPVSFRFAVPASQYIVRTDHVIRRWLMQRANHAEPVRQMSQSRQHLAELHARQRCLNGSQFSAKLDRRFRFWIERLEMTGPAVLPEQNERTLPRTG